MLNVPVLNGIMMLVNNTVYALQGVWGLMKGAGSAIMALCVSLGESSMDGDGGEN